MIFFVCMSMRLCSPAETISFQFLKIWNIKNVDMRCNRKVNFSVIKL